SLDLGRSPMTSSRSTRNSLRRRCFRKRNDAGRSCAMSDISSMDAAFMRRALRLAQRGSTSPNPMVGAVLVKNGRVLGEGWHHRAGKPHAEIEALNAAASKEKSARGATLYVSLEPCCTFGRTPPCTEAIIQ